MPTNRVSYAFLREPDAPFLVFSEGVVIGMTGNPAYTTPRISLATLATENANFRNALAASEGGGVVNTALKDAARQVVEDLLRPQAAYVQSIAGDDLAMLLSSGFQAVKNTRTRIVLPQPEIVRLDCPQSTCLGVRVKPVATARAYEVRMKNGTGDYQTVGIFTYARLILINGVVPGQTYTVQVRAIGGLTGYSDWSDPSSRMAM
ncbi:MAG TPA: fibronectin type III domain-containing protein [Verrucomicrobiae bacterium]|jgi:hypothetical protein